MTTNRNAITRRLFLQATATLAAGLRTLASGHGPIAQGRFKDEDVRLAQNRLLDLVNTERAQAGLSALQLDDLAGKVEGQHARDMVNSAFLSHWGRDGRKPYQRYSFAGGTDAIQENVSAADHIGSMTTNSVIGDLIDMHTKMHNETPPNDGHRRAILAPQHTHVGFGIALSGQNLRLAELYVSRYMQFDPSERKANRKSTVLLTGSLLNAKHFLYEVDVFYEPLPNPANDDWKTRRPYALPADYIALRPKAPRGMTYTDGTRGEFECDRKGKFNATVKLSKDAPGIYTIVFWMKHVIDEKAFPAGTICLEGQ